MARTKRIPKRDGIDLKKDCSKTIDDGKDIIDLTDKGKDNKVPEKDKEVLEKDKVVLNKDKMDKEAIAKLQKDLKNHTENSTKPENDEECMTQPKKDKELLGELEKHKDVLAENKEVIKKDKKAIAKDSEITQEKDACEVASLGQDRPHKKRKMNRVQEAQNAS